MSRRQIVALVAPALVVASGSTLPGIALAAAQEVTAFQTRVKFLNADTDGGEYEVFINSDNVLDQFGYGDESDWIDLDPGAVRLTITADRIGFNWAVFDAVYPVAAGNDFIVVISDALVIASAIDASELPADRARVRLTHASADTPRVDVVVSGTDTTLVSGLGYGRSSEYAEVPAGSYDLDVIVSDTGDVALSLPGVTIDAGTVYDFIAMGTAGDEERPLTVTQLVREVGDDTAPMASPAG